MNSENDLPRLQVLTESTARFAREFIETQGGTVQGGSPGDVEAADPDYGDLSRKAHLYGVMQLVAAHDSIGALRPVMASGTGVYSLSVLARAGLEASGRAGWLLEVGIGARRRAERALSEELYSLTQRRTALNAILERVRREPERVERTRQQLDRVETQRQEVVTLGHGLNLTPVLGGKKKEVLAFGEARPSGTTVAAEILGAAGMEAGGDVYRLFSGSAHATVAALARQFEEGPEIAPGVRMAIVTMTRAQLHTSVAIPLWGWSEAFDRAVHQMGWNEDDWSGWRFHVLKTLALTFPQEG